MIVLPARIAKPALRERANCPKGSERRFRSEVFAVAKVKFAHSASEVYHCMISEVLPNGKVMELFYIKFPTLICIAKNFTRLNNNVVTCRPVSDKEIRDFKLVNISKKGRKKKYVKRNSKK